ncbi:protoporphyrinogen oxidase [Cryptosporangium aurantiacum]|uniref:protoporphyrinogen oxidase n=1 Tax=Cryptosporangium aurantiacum TaxID=134849 RepID=UPI001C4A2656|nr:protoporphyrinogen oxidase [Cryptosporangium aurantiacum]
MLFEDRVTRPLHVVVVGGGIAGLAAALRIRDTAPDGTAVTVIEQSGSVGGKLRTGRVAGVPVEDGAESFLLRVPEARALAERVGLAHDLVSPTAAGATVWVDGMLRALPAGTLLGVPADLEATAASGVLSDDGLALVRAESCRPGVPLGDSDVAVGALIADRLGSEVLDRLVEPLLGGVYAGQASRLSLRATMPALAAGLADQPSLVKAARAARGNPRPETPPTPMFATVRGGLSRLVTTVAHESKAAIRTGLPVRALQRTPDGWQLTVGSAGLGGSTTVRADAVVLAVPAAPASRLLADVDATAAGTVGVLEYASVGLVSLVLPGRLPLPPGTGALVPASSGRLVKAVTYVSQKWGHVVEARGLDGYVGDPVTVVRASVGRHGEETALQRDDESLVATVLEELGTLVPLPGGWPAPLGVKVNRWGGALPQYAPGHLDRVAAVRAALATEPTLALAGAAYDGVGIPACIRSGQAAADQILSALATRVPA